MRATDGLACVVLVCMQLHICITLCAADVRGSIYMNAYTCGVRVPYLKYLGPSRSVRVATSTDVSSDGPMLVVEAASMEVLGIVRILDSLPVSTSSSSGA